MQKQLQICRFGKDVKEHTEKRPARTSRTFGRLLCSFLRSLMHRHGLQHISSTAARSRTFLQYAHSHTINTGKSVESPSRAYSKKQGNPSLPPLPKSKKFSGSLDGGRRPTKESRDAPNRTFEGVREVIQAYARGSRKPGQTDTETAALERIVQSTVPSLNKTQFFSKTEPDADPVFEQDEFLTIQSLLPGTFIELRRYVLNVHTSTYRLTVDCIGTWSLTMVSSCTRFRRAVGVVYGP